MEERSQQQLQLQRQRPQTNHSGWMQTYSTMESFKPLFDDWLEDSKTESFQTLGLEKKKEV